MDVCEKAEEEAWKWNADFKKWIWGKPCESSHLLEHGRREDIEGGKVPGEDTPVMAQDQERHEQPALVGARLLSACFLDP